MPAASPPDDETERLSALHRLGILDTAPADAFDVFPTLARSLFSTPIAAISFIDKDRQWNKSEVGLGVTELPRAHSLCAHAINCPTDTLYVPDTTRDPRFADNPFVTGDFHLRFYAGVPITDADGYALGALCVMDHQPRTMTHQALGQLRDLAVGVGSTIRLHGLSEERRLLCVTDPLTTIENRAGFDHRLRRALASEGGLGCGIALLFLDLDGFKSINDLFGHAGGDAALQEVARRLVCVTGERGSVARFGGDEFCILLSDMSPSDLQTIADHIHEAIARPFFLDGHALQLRTSIGIALAGGRTDPDSLVRDADAALTEAKRAGRSVSRFADAQSPDGESPTGRVSMQDMLRRALLPSGREPFTLALQPIFEGRTTRLVAFEALVRWPDGDRVRQPADFIPVAEATGLVVQLDHWVLDQACALAASWPEPVQVASNLSAANFATGDLAQEVEAILERRGLAPGRLRLEITETVLLHDPARVRDIIRKLQALGVHLILDDFGAGHASLAYLRDYPFDGLKIDRSFTAAIETDPRTLVFVRAIIGMAKSLGMDVTAEGVETEGQLRSLQRRGIATVQGHLLGRPMTPDAAAALIRSHQRSRTRPAPAHADLACLACA